MKLFAFFLPQFHEVKENNEWWGEGFTEWTHVRGAKPLYKGHDQPKTPLNGNYYNLLEKSTVEEQTRLMKEYGVDGLVYYHYWFQGQKLLERPAENLLGWQDIEQPFFFCWANHSWFKATEAGKTLLREQTYGDEAAWEEHFQYLLPFFKDARYEKKDGKPLFMIFKTDFPEKKAMMAYFDTRCVESGFAGICVIETVGNIPGEAERAAKTPQTDYLFMREPNTATAVYRRRVRLTPAGLYKKACSLLGRKGFKRFVPKYDGCRLYDCMIRHVPKNEKDLMHGAFFAWDNTPRHSSRGYIILPPDKQRFFTYMDAVRSDDYVIINAWNEWAEGMMLEPTESEGYRYLEWIREWKGNVPKT